METVEQVPFGAQDDGGVRITLERSLHVLADLSDRQIASVLRLAVPADAVEVLKLAERQIDGRQTFGICP
jgi:hypothetical protein